MVGIFSRQETFEGCVHRNEETAGLARSIIYQGPRSASCQRTLSNGYIYLSLVVGRRAVCLRREAVANVSNHLNNQKGALPKYEFGDRDDRSLDP